VTWAVFVMEIFNLSDTVLKFNQAGNLTIFVEKSNYKLPSAFSFELFAPLICVFGFKL
jgi:hypothetical protein